MIRLKTIVLFLSIAFCTLPCTGVRAQDTPTRGLQKALNRVFKKGNLMVALSTVEWRPGLALAATQLPAGATASLELALRPDANYSFIATADKEGTDVDLYLRDSSGNILAQDQEDDGTPVLEFQVPATGNYTLQVHLAAADTPDNYVAISLLRSAGQSVIEGDFLLLSNRFFTATTALMQATPDLVWLKQANSWPILGFAAEGNAPLDLVNLRLPASRYQLAGTASSSFRNLSLYLANSKGKIVAQSDAKSPFPFLKIKTTSEQSYQMRIMPKGSSAEGLFLLGVFQH